MLVDCGSCDRQSQIRLPAIRQIANAQESKNHHRPCGGFGDRRRQDRIHSARKLSIGYEGQSRDESVGIERIHCRTGVYPQHSKARDTIGPTHEVSKVKH